MILITSLVTVFFLKHKRRVPLCSVDMKEILTKKLTPGVFLHQVFLEKLDSMELTKNAFVGLHFIQKNHWFYS